MDRNSKFRRAIHNKIKKGCRTVLDVGTGTGLLSLYAAEAGAERVYACEAAEVMAVTAADVFSVNPGGERVRLLSKLSLDLNKQDVPEPVDLLVTETFDAGLLGEHVLESVHCAWENQLRYPSARAPHCMPSSVVPGAADIFIQPIQCKHIQNQHRFTSDKFGYLESSHLLVKSSSSEPYSSEALNEVPGGFQPLAPPTHLIHINFQDRRQVSSLIEKGVDKVISVTATADGDCDAIAAWFTLHLDETERIETAPGKKTCWHQAIFPVKSLKSKVHKGNTLIILKFSIKKHVELKTIDFREKEDKFTNGNGICPSKMRKDDLSLPTWCLKQINSGILEQVYQWVAYYAARDVGCSNILDCTGLPLLGLQVAKLKQAANLTLLLKTEDRETGRNLLDVVTSLAKANSISVNNISCITDFSGVEDRYSVVLVSPVLRTGRLDQELMYSLPDLIGVLQPSSGLILPHSVSIYCQVVESEQLCECSHLRSNQPVSGFKIADQINILAVTHLQDIQLKTLSKKELTEPVEISVVDLTRPDLSRRFRSTEVKVKQSGQAHAVVYWFVQQFGWGVQYSTLDDENMAQGAVMVTECQLLEGDSLTIHSQEEEGLLNFTLSKT